MEPIAYSVFELFKIGPGPSSSHTIGPMKAGHHFIETLRGLPPDLLAKAGRIDAGLYGSLAATGAGHGTDRALLAGLLGHAPEHCPPDLLDTLAKDAAASHYVDLGPAKLSIALRDIRNVSVEHNFPFANTMVLRLLAGENLQGPELYRQEYYSVGGGFIQWKGYTPPQRGTPRHAYWDAASLSAVLREKGVTLDRLMLENEMDVTGSSEEAIAQGLDKLLDTMEASVERGLKVKGVLPGPIGLHRKAARVFEQVRDMASPTKRFLGLLNAYALAAIEENATGHISVTAPTLGSCGIIPSVNRIMERELGIERDKRRQGLLAAAAVGFLVMRNASIAGAEVGCQGEVGVASSMAAAMLAHCQDLPLPCVFNAAESALEHHLGLTCDPVMGYVQVPCIERNAMSAVKAYNAYLLSEVVMPAWHKVDLDKTIRAMAETGHDMCPKYKETSLGGLAAAVHC